MSAVPASSEGPKQWRSWAYFYEEGLRLREMLSAYDGEFEPESYADRRMAEQEKAMLKIDLKV